MSTEIDRELLSLAAKAAGYYMLWWPDQPGSEKRTKIGAGAMPWDPLVDDGDAFRLGVKFRVFGTDEFLRFLGVAYLECTGQDETVMWRRAIVLTVAAIGRAMP